MALTQNSTILISDISSALSEKQDKLTYIPVKSVNGTSADANGAVTISTGGGTATTVSGVAVYSRNDRQNTHKSSGGFGITYTKDSDGDYLVTLKFPSGGTWKGITDRPDYTSAVTASGGSTFASSGWVTTAIAIKVA